MPKKILIDHTQKGKLFTPPLLSIGNFVDAGWLDFAVPELIWISLLMEKYGNERGTILFLEFTSICDSFITNKSANGSAPCIISSYALLNEVERKVLNKILNKTILFVKLKDALKPFMELYPECPFNLFFGVPSRKPAKKYLTQYKATLDKMMDKVSVQSTYVMASIAAFLINFNRISLVKGNKIPHLSEVTNYPNSEDSQHLASFLRTVIPMCFNVESYERTNSWVQYFWNQSYKLEPYKL